MFSLIRNYHMVYILVIILRTVINAQENQDQAKNAIAIKTSGNSKSINYLFVELKLKFNSILIYSEIFSCGSCFSCNNGFCSNSTSASKCNCFSNYTGICCEKKGLN